MSVSSSRLRLAATTRTLGALILPLLVATAANSQTIHLPPVFRPALPKGTIVLTVRAKECSTELSKFGVQNGQVVVGHSSGTTDVIALANRKIRDVVSELRDKYPAHLDTLGGSDYPLYDATLLAEKVPVSLTCATDATTARRALEDARASLAQAKAALETKKGEAEVQLKTATRREEDARIAVEALAPLVTIEASSGEPDVTFGFGLVMSPSPSSTSDEAATANGLLSAAGFQLDIIGSHLFWRRSAATGRTPTTGWSGVLSKFAPTLYGQARLGLHGNQQLNVQGSEGEGQQIESAIQQAQQVAVTAHVPMVWTIVEERMDFMLTPSIGLTWTQLDPFVFPTIRLNATAMNVDQLFDADPVADARKVLNRTLPLKEYGVQAGFHFRRSQNTLFYFGVARVQKQTPLRHFQFGVPIPGVTSVLRRIRCQTRCPDITAEPVRTGLTGFLDTPSVPFWQVMFGWRVAGLFDLRVDALRPSASSAAEPLLRVVIGKSFPVTTPTK